MGIDCCKGAVPKEPEVCEETQQEIPEEPETAFKSEEAHHLSLASISTQSSLTSPPTGKKLREKKVSFDLGDGSTYKGEWLNGMRDGKGKLTNDNGHHYTGEWLADMKHGFGKQDFKNGDIYFGQWFEDLQEGNGTLQ